MTKNNLSEEKKAINKINSLLEARPAKKKTWWSRLLHLGRLFGDVGEYVFDDEAHAEKIKQDIMKIESERLEEKRQLDLERQKIEEQARIQAAQKAQQDKQFNWSEKSGGLQPETAADRLQAVGAVPVEILKDATPSLAMESAPELHTAVAKPVSVPVEPAPKLAPAMPVDRPAAKPAAVELANDKLKPELPPIIIEQKVKGGWFKALKKSAAKVAEADKAAAAMPAETKLPAAAKAAVKPEKKAPIFLEHKDRMAKRLADELAREAKLFAKNEVENRYWQSFNIIRANLIKEQRSLFFNWKGKVLTLVFASALSLLMVLASFLYLVIRQEQKLKDNKSVFDNLESIKQQIVKEESRLQEINYFSDSLLYVRYLLDNHIYWSRFFELLENRTIPSIYYESFAGDLTGNYKVPAVAKDFSSITTQSKVLLGKEGDIEVFGADATDTKRFDGATAPAAATSGDMSESGGVSRRLNNGDVTFILNLSVNPQAVFLKPEEQAAK